MSHIDTAVSSTVSFETDGTSAWSKILHNIAYDIQADGLKIQRIAIFEKPLLARIYIKDMTFKREKQKRFQNIFKLKADPYAYDYVVCLELQERPYFRGSCSYKIERCTNSYDIKKSKKYLFSDRFEQITDLLSHTILKSLMSSGGRNFGIRQLA